MTEKFLPRSHEELMERYGWFQPSRRGGLNAANVPEDLRPLMPYAELWGVLDDLEREQLIMSAPIRAKEDLATIVDMCDKQLDSWLAGPEADSANPTEEYLAFSAMRMARDFI